MKVVIQRVSQASVTVDEKLVCRIGPGFLVLVGLHVDDTPEKFDYFIKKILNLRVFPDDQDRMNTSILDNEITNTKFCLCHNSRSMQIARKVIAHRLLKRCRRIKQKLCTNNLLNDLESSMLPIELKTASLVP